MRFTTALFVLLICFIQHAIAGPIKGVVKDKISSEPLVGATIFIKSAKVATTAGLDGSFTFKNLNNGMQSFF